MAPLSAKHPLRPSPSHSTSTQNEEEGTDEIGPGGCNCECAGCDLNTFHCGKASRGCRRK